MNGSSAEDYNGSPANSLRVFFRPKSVAVIGASEKPGSVGRAVLWNLISTPFGGTIYPVNRKHKAVLGIRAYRSVVEVPDRCELAVVATPAEQVPQVIDECGEAGVKGAVIISAGFRETGAQGLELEQQTLAVARKRGVRLIGPNCLGVMCPPSGLNATFAPRAARSGTVALISQSGAICTALLDWSLREQVGFSALVSVGSMVDVGWGELIDYLAHDPKTRSIVMYMESIGDARSFLSAARQTALMKPILVIKAGRSELAAKAAASHTGSMTGSDAVVDAAFRRVGVLRVNSLSEVFELTEVLSFQPRPPGLRLAIVTNAGGPGVLAMDAVAALGIEPCSLTQETIDALDRVLPPHWSRANPVDIIGDAGPDRYEQAVRIVSADRNADGLLVIMTPQAISDPVAIAQRMAPFSAVRGKPLLASWMGGERAREGEAVLHSAGIPTFAFPDSAVAAFHSMWRYSYNLRALYETPSAAEDEAGGEEAASRLIGEALDSGRTLLTEFESKQVLGFYGIATGEIRLASSEAQAVAAAEAIGYPAVLKLNSHTISHKTEVGGVKLWLHDGPAVHAAYREIRRDVCEKAGPEHFQGVTVQRMATLDGYELIVGSSIDPHFGPVLMFGAGGQLVEVLEDRALGLPPLNTTLARRMMEQTRIYKALKGVRGRPAVDLEGLEHLLTRCSQMILEQKWIRELDINPLLASPDGLMALDARVVLHPKGTSLSAVPRPAIRPYPTEYISEAKLGDGTLLQIRPIKPEDEPDFLPFHAALSDESVYNRYFSLMKLETRTQHERLANICFIDYDRQMALVAVDRGSDSPSRIAGVGRMIRTPGMQTAEVAVLVIDAFQGRGLGTVLIMRLIEIARKEGLSLLTASFLSRNASMQKVFAKLGFSINESDDPEVRVAELKL